MKLNIEKILNEIHSQFSIPKEVEFSFLERNRYDKYRQDIKDFLINTLKNNKISFEQCISSYSGLLKCDYICIIKNNNKIAGTFGIYKPWKNHKIIEIPYASVFMDQIVKAPYENSYYRFRTLPTDFVDVLSTNSNVDICYVASNRLLKKIPPHKNGWVKKIGYFPLSSTKLPTNIYRTLYYKIYKYNEFWNEYLKKCSSNNELFEKLVTDDKEKMDWFLKQLKNFGKLR